MATMECFKHCCKNFMKREKEQETQVIAVRMAPAKQQAAPGGGLGPGDMKRGVGGVSEDYLLSKLPPDGREVPFVLPTFKPSYIQPRGARYPSLQSGLQSSARTTYAERKAELSSSSNVVYNPDFHYGQMADHTSPGSPRRDTLKNKSPASRNPGWELKNEKQRLSSSMFDLSSPVHMQRFDSVTSVQSSASFGSSLDSITLSGDERELGKVCVRISYQEALEQLWITLVQCADLHLPVEGGAEQQRMGFKGIITLNKPIQFKSSVKEYSQDAVFMETYVFALRLQQLRCSALVLRLQTHHPKKRSVAECVLSLRQLGAVETDHWLDLSPPSKSSVCHSELHLATCFQPVNGRIQLQVLAAQNLPASSSPLTQTFFVKAEMYESGRAVTKKKTRVLKAVGSQCKWAETFHFLLAALEHDSTLSVKLYSRSSVRRKHLLGQVHLGFASPAAPEAVEQWKDAMANPEKVVSAWHRLSAGS